MINSLNLPSMTTTINVESIENGTVRQQIVSFIADNFMERKIEWLHIEGNVNRSSFFRSALRDLISRYQELGVEPFEIDDMYNDSEHKLTRTYCFAIDNEIEQELLRLKTVYTERNIQFNRSHLIRWAVYERLPHLLLEDMQAQEEYSIELAAQEDD